jgi:thermitase
MRIYSKWLVQVLTVLITLSFPVVGVLAAGEIAPEETQNHFFLPLITAGTATSIETAVPNQVIVKYSGEVQSAAVSAVFSTLNAVVVSDIAQLNAQVLELPEENVQAAMEVLAAQPSIVSVEPNYVATGAFIPNDALYTNQYGPQIIQAPAAWDYSQGNSNVIVAVIDSGADFAHPDLQGKLIAGYDYVNGDSDPTDDLGHGTHVAGIIAANFNNAAGVASIGANVKVLVMKVLNSSNTGSYSNFARAIVDATDRGARIINLSLGGLSASTTLQDAVRYAWQHNVLVVAAAGNNGQNTLFYPAAYPEVLAVTMTDSKDAFNTNSNYGDWVDLAAPGTSIRSTYWSGGLSTYASMTGTSMATPHVAGVAALILSTRSMSNREVRDILLATADDKGATGRDNYYGYGRVNALRAVQQALLVVQPSPTVAPTATATPAPTMTPAPTATPVPTVVLIQPTPTYIHLGDMDASGAKNGRDWRAIVNILVEDANHKPVSSATVTGVWLNGVSSTGSCTTGSNGWCSISSPKITNNTASVTFIVGNVIGLNYIYVPTSNYDPDNDASGAQIAVSKP